MIAILDYGIGNLRSLSNALKFCDIPHNVTRDTTDIAEAKGLILPGVGAFNAGMVNLKQFGLIDALRARIKNNKPTLGICLGFQLMCESSEEFGLHQGLGSFKTTVKKIHTTARLPHIGWTTVEEVKGARLAKLFMGTEGKNFYFVHSFCITDTPAITGKSFTTYGGDRFISAAAEGNIFGVQFHPEKSSLHGLQIIKNFYRISLEESL
jgi:glutamine amidotransferase